MDFDRFSIATRGMNSAWCLLSACRAWMWMRRPRHASGWAWRQERPTPWTAWPARDRKDPWLLGEWSQLEGWNTFWVFFFFSEWWLLILMLYFWHFAFESYLKHVHPSKMGTAAILTTIFPNGLKPSSDAKWLAAICCFLQLGANTWGKSCL